MSRATEFAPPTSKIKLSEATPPKKKESTRDLVEQLVVAFILAVLIKGFEVEAFVIPTGSMAPTLYGQHKEAVCPHCTEVFAVNASEEAGDNRGFLGGGGGNARAGSQVAAATCPNCRGPVRELDQRPSFKGDRILVMKFLYSLPKWLGGRPPQRWDVVVFHYPEEPETNYIKRLVGLPSEILRISFGDILTQKPGSTEPFRMQHKPLDHQAAMQQLVWDDTHRPAEFARFPAWNRWGGAKVKSTDSGYTITPDGSKWSEVRYRHLVPNPGQWTAALNGTDPGMPKPSLISDFYGYNSGINASRKIDSGDWYLPHWVGDLTISATIRPELSATHLRLELVEGGIKNRCEIDLKSGQAQLFRNDTPLGNPAATELRGDGKDHAVAFANVDDRLTLWVDGKTPFGDGMIYDVDGLDVHAAPTPADLAPAAISSRGGEVHVSGLVLKRDIYYTQDPGRSDYEGVAIPWPTGNDDPETRIAQILDILGDPAQFPGLGELKSKVDYPIESGRYMMMGDNSPRSKDGRGWARQDFNGYYDPIRGEQVEPWAGEGDRKFFEVPESHLIGKAFFIYWPHGVPFWPNIGVSRDFRVPFRPYVERMKWIR